MTKLLDIKEAIYTLSKHIRLKGILCDRTLLDILVSEGLENCWDSETIKPKDNLNEYDDLKIFGVDCRDNRIYGFAERYSDE